jgi:nitrate reductase molybdenum cofactor assembly chaperone NarJ/NarW
MSPLPTSVHSMVRTKIRAASRRRHGDQDAPLATPEEAREREHLLRMLSLLLQYPDAELTDGAADLVKFAEELGDSRPAAEIREFLDWFATEDPDALQTHYVQVFDLRRKSSLYLTYYLHGDTRRRGMALLTLAQRYRALGWEADTGELPDHLPVVLEFAALAGPGKGEAPLRQHRQGVRLIERALRDAESPYRHLLAALCDLLPPPGEGDEEAVARLMAEGPPNEEVGADPYGGQPFSQPAYGQGEFAPHDAFVPPMPAPPTRTSTDGPR